MTLRREIVYNMPTPTTLNGAINSSVTTITVVTGGLFPSTGDFRVQIDNEIMLATARSGNDITVVRGQENTSAVSHSSGATVFIPLTAESFRAQGRDNDPYYYSQRPALARIVDASSNRLLVADFSWVTQAGSNAYNQDNTIAMVRPTHATAGERGSALVRSAPSTPFAVRAAFRFSFPYGSGIGGMNGGLIVRESSTGEFIALAMNHFGENVIYRFNSTTSFASTAYGPFPWYPGDLVWFKIVDDGTDLIFHISHDGINWSEIHSESRTSFMAGGPDQIGFYINGFQAMPDAWVTLCHWDEGLTS